MTIDFIIVQPQLNWWSEGFHKKVIHLSFFYVVIQVYLHVILYHYRCAIKKLMIEIAVELIVLDAHEF